MLSALQPSGGAVSRRISAIVTTMIRYAPVLALVAVLTAGNADAFIQPGTVQQLAA